jgi:hypothetical protein
MIMIKIKKHVEMMVVLTVDHTFTAVEAFQKTVGRRHIVSGGDDDGDDDDDDDDDDDEEEEEQRSCRG